MKIDKKSMSPVFVRIDKERPGGATPRQLIDPIQIRMGSSINAVVIWQAQVSLSEKRSVIDNTGALMLPQKNNGPRQPPGGLSFILCVYNSISFNSQ